MKSLSLLALGVTTANAQLVEASFKDASTPTGVTGVNSLLPAGSLEVALMIVLAVATVTIQVIHKYRNSRDIAHRRFE
jgi:hypothetical protein